MSQFPKYQGSYTAVQIYQGIKYELTISSDVMIDLPDPEISDEITAQLRRGILAQMYPYTFKTEDEWVEEMKQDAQLSERITECELEDRS